MTEANAQLDAQLKKIGNDVKMMAMAVAIAGKSVAPDTIAGLRKAERDYITVYAARFTVGAPTAKQQEALEQQAKEELRKLTVEGADIGRNLHATYVATGNHTPQPHKGESERMLVPGDSLTRVVTKQPGMIDSARAAIKASQRCGTPQKVDDRSATNTAVLVTGLVSGLKDVDLVRVGEKIKLVGEPRMQQVVDMICEKGMIRDGRLRYSEIKDLVVNNPTSWPVAGAGKPVRLVQRH